MRSSLFVQLASGAPATPRDAVQDWLEASALSYSVLPAEIKLEAQLPLYRFGRQVQRVLPAFVPQRLLGLKVQRGQGYGGLCVVEYLGQLPHLHLRRVLAGTRA